MSNSYPPVPPAGATPGTPASAGTSPPVVFDSGSGASAGVGSGFGSGSSSDSGTGAKAKEQASHVAGDAKEATQQVAGTAKEEASKVAGEVKTQAKDLFKQTSSELKEQAGAQQQRAAAGLHTLSDELKSMADNSDGGGVAADLVQQVASRASGVASWLEDRDPGTLLDDVRDFARRKPGTFIGLAAVAGVLAGRLTRSLVSGGDDDDSDAASAPSTSTSSTARRATSPATHVAAPPVSGTPPTVTGVGGDAGFVAGRPLGSDPLGTDPLGTNPLGTDPLRGERRP
ncbi:hypothetical protein B0I08_105226 [Glaciihabitans tibetensis]|uniref:F0F1-type ATP synthase membrane subunit b/b n=1 Tax=Glaciihabitans tibetensis TaxID=1266600 RepID=A0A2T0VD07_9MICO|nr:hypothetical protein [Glaciihabitans tibetensis]PRY68061.1 hypothetical protein B0I08_105226 [Glaciihabitans tibetensis]